MPILRITYNNIEGRKTEKISQAVEVSTNTHIKDIRKEKLGAGDAIAIDFKLETDYKPNIGVLSVEGTVYYVSAELEKVIKMEGTKIRLSPEVVKEIHTAILREPVIVAINTAERLGLPMPINFPMVEVSKAPAAAKAPEAKKSGKAK